MIDIVKAKNLYHIVQFNEKSNIQLCVNNITDDKSKSIKRHKVSLVRHHFTCPLEVSAAISLEPLERSNRIS